MHADMPLIATLAAAFGLALALGLVAVKLRLPALVGYLLAGIVAERFGLGPTLAFNGFAVILATGIAQFRLAANPTALEQLKARLGS